MLAAAMVAAGVCALAFPHARQAVYQMGVDDARASFDARVEDDGGSVDSATLHALLDARNRDLYETDQAALTSADSYETDDIDLTDYGLPESNVIGYLEVPAMGVSLPIILGASQGNMNHGACHLTETSYPIGGANTNCVIAAHRGDVSGLRLFRDIERVRVGDGLTIANFENTLRYACVETRVIDPWDVEAVKIQEGRDLVTLSTCHPLGLNDERYIAVFERIG